MENPNEQIRRLVVCKQTCCWSITEHVYTFIRVFFDTKAKCQKIKFQNKCLECGHQFVDECTVECWLAMQSQSEPN